MNIPKSGKVIFRNIKKWLKTFDIFFPLRYSSTALTLEEQLFPVLKRSLTAERQLYGQILAAAPSSSLVFDIGANVGYSTAIFLENKTSVICVEPVVYNLKCLKARFKDNPNVTILDKAVSNHQGVSSIYLQDEGTSLHTLNTKWKTFLTQKDHNRWENAVAFSKKMEVQTITLDQLIANYGLPFFIKIDVEGHEYEVIKSLSQPVPQLCFEANLPQFLEETIGAIHHLIDLDASSHFNYSTGDRLLLEQYINGADFIRFLHETDLIYMDIFCQSNDLEPLIIASQND